MTVRSKTYWIAKLVTGYIITQDDWVDLLDTFLIYTPPTEPTIVAGTPNELTIDFVGAEEAAFEPKKTSSVRTIDAATYPTLSILFSNFENLKFFAMALSLTGVIAIQFPDGTGGQPNVKVSQEGGLSSWDDATKILTITAGTDDVIGIVGRNDASGSFFDLRIGGAAV